MVKLSPAFLLLAATGISAAAAKKDKGKEDAANREDIIGCLGDATHCGTDPTSCCISYYVPFCGDLNDYGASVINGGALTCLTPEDQPVGPVVQSASDVSDTMIELVGPSFRECLRQLNETEIATIDECTALPEMTAAADAATSSAKTGSSAFAAAGMAAAGIIGAFAMN